MKCVTTTKQVVNYTLTLSEAEAQVLRALLGAVCDRTAGQVGYQLYCELSDQMSGEQPFTVQVEEGSRYPTLTDDAKPHECGKACYYECVGHD